MTICIERSRKWHVWMPLLFILLTVYLYLYNNTFNSTRTSTVLESGEVDIEAVENNFQYSKDEVLDSLKVESPSSYLQKLKRHSVTLTQINNHVIATKDLVSQKSEKNSSLPLLTLFTTWNDSPDKYVVHNITMLNWATFIPLVIPILFTSNVSLVKESTILGWNVLPIPVAVEGSVPVLKYMYLDAMENFNSTFYAYSNGDILFTNSLIETLIFLRDTIVNYRTPVLIVGRRVNVFNVTKQEGSSLNNLVEISKSRGKLFTGWAEDYFITTRAYPWVDVAEVVIGRKAYDNWLVYRSRKAMHIVIDATNTILAVHQTTEAGNFEGHGHSNGEYNQNLLLKLYRRIKYGAGMAGCIELYTVSVNETFQIKFRTRPKNCAT